MDLATALLCVRCDQPIVDSSASGDEIAAEILAHTCAPAMPVQRESS